MSVPQAKVVQNTANAVVRQSMWGKRADGQGVVVLLAAIGRALQGKAGSIDEYKDPKLGERSAAPLHSLPPRPWPLTVHSLL